MSDLIHLMNGAPGWRGSWDSQLVEVFREYDQPLEGILEQAGCRYLFTCIGGEIEPWSAWLYMHVEESEIDELRAAASDDEAWHEVIARYANDRGGQLAISLESGGIVAFVPVQRFLKDIGRASDELMDEFARYVRRAEQVKDDLTALDPGARLRKFVA